MIPELESFEKWLSLRPEQEEFIDVLNLIKEAQKRDYALNIQINTSPKGNITFDSGKTSLNTLKKLILTRG